MRPLKTVVTAVRIRGLELRIADFDASCVVKTVPEELAADAYQFEVIPFQPGDIVLDVGANVGIASIYLAKRQPQIRIHAFEPVPENYRHLTRNLERNQVRNVVAHHLAVTRDGRRFPMLAHFHSNSGSASGCYQDLRANGCCHYEVASTTLDAIFADHGIDRCRLLKIDCEGAEHEILLNTSVLGRIEWLSGEFHLNAGLQRAGYSPQNLEAHCRKFIAADKLKVHPLRIPD